MLKNKKRICISLGDPSGVGPEIIAKTLNVPSVRKSADFIVVGDACVFEDAYKKSLSDFKYNVLKKEESFTSPQGILFVDLKNVDIKNFVYGKMNPQYGSASIEYIEYCYYLIKKKQADAMVTGPINKESVKKSGFKYNGHTEFLKHISGSGKIAMMLTGGPFTVVLATTHIPINKVSKLITKKHIFDLICLVNKCMKGYFNITSCSIAVCGLNPHAGENGFIGAEDDAAVKPAIAQAQSFGINVSGPYPSDALFYDIYNNSKFDVVLCMYHDQGLIPLKMIARNEAVNITLGLPFIRTSPAHGTAFDIAGKNIADPNSFYAAIKTAVSMAESQNLSGFSDA